MFCQHCKDSIGIEVFYDTDTREYTYRPEIYGHYELQRQEVNGQVYFKKGDRSIWWNEVNGIGQWNFGIDCYAQLDSETESIRPIGYFVSDAQCPHQITERNGKLKMRYGEELENWEDAGNSLALRPSFRGK